MVLSVVDMKRTGRNITVLRQRRGIAVRDLQEMLGIATPQAIYKWQRGETLPSIENLAALACILGVTIDEILAVECHAKD
ncbi:MAG: helix-turn-helix transcriptional regulator [Clostridia bacterium]